MNKRFIGVLIFAFVVASVASLMLYRLLLNRPQSAKAAQPSMQIVLATRDLELGTVLKEEDVKLADWPGAVPAGAATKAEDVVGRGVITPIYAKEPVIDSRLAPKGAGGGLAAMIPQGMRAVAVRVNEVVGVAGFVVPGMHVDVLISGTKPGGDGNLGTLTRTLLQNLEVLSAGQDFKKDAEGKPVAVQVVNLLVTPEQAEQLSLASNQTTIQLVLRNPLDHEIAKTPGTAMAVLFNGGKLKSPVRRSPIPGRPDGPVRPAIAVAAPAAKKEPPFVMEIISGNKKAETKFTPAGRVNRCYEFGMSLTFLALAACGSWLCYSPAPGQRAGAGDGPAGQCASHGSVRRPERRSGQADGHGGQVADHRQPAAHRADFGGQRGPGGSGGGQPKEVLINGKAPGETSLIVWQQNGARLIYDLTVR